MNRKHNYFDNPLNKENNICLAAIIKRLMNNKFALCGLFHLLVLIVLVKANDSAFVINKYDGSLMSASTKHNRVCASKAQDIIYKSRYC